MAKKNKTSNKLNSSIIGVVGLFFAYAILSRALNTGSYWQYLAGFLFLIQGTRLIIKSIKDQK